MASIYLPALDYGDEEDAAPSEALQSLEEKISKLSTDEPSVNKLVPAKEERLPKVIATVDRNASLASLISEASGAVDTFDIRIADPAPKADNPQVNKPKGVLRKKGKAKAKDAPVESFAVRAAKASATKAHTQYQLVERLLDDACETEEELLHLVLGKFTRDEYKEVVEERYIAGACGNPLCRNPAPLDLARKGKYKIVLHQHKVYETPPATRLCSPKCNVVTERVCCALDAGPPATVDPTSSIKHVPTIKPWDRNVGAVGEGKVVMLGHVKERISSGSPQELTSGPAVDKGKAAAAAAGAVDGYVPRERNEPKRGARISQEVEHCSKPEERQRRVSFCEEVTVLIEPEESILETASPPNERHVRFSEELESRVFSEVKEVLPSSRERRVSFSEEEDKVLPVARERRVSFSNDVEVVPAAKESTLEVLPTAREHRVSFSEDVEVVPAAKENTSEVKEVLPLLKERRVSFTEDDDEVLPVGSERHVSFSEESETSISSEVKEVLPVSHERRVSFTEEEDEVLPVGSERHVSYSEELETCVSSEVKEVPPLSHERRVSFTEEEDEVLPVGSERHVSFSEELETSVSSEVKEVKEVLPSSHERRVSFTEEEDEVLPVARDRRVSFSNDVEVVPAAKESTAEVVHAGPERHVSFNQDVEVLPAAKESTSDVLPAAREQHVSFSENVEVFPAARADTVETVPTGPPTGPPAPVLQFNILGLMKEDTRIGESLPGCGMEGMLSRVDNESTPTTPRAPAAPPIVGHLPGTNPVDCVVKERVVQAVEPKRADTTRSPNDTAQGKPLQPAYEGEASAPGKEPVDWDFGDDDDNMMDDDDDVEDLDQEEKQSSKSNKSSREPMPLSRFALLWDLLSNWVTPATGDFLAQRPSYRTADLNAAGDSGIISHTNDITVAVSRNISRYLPSLTRTLQIVMYQTLEVEIDSLLATFRFRYAAPHLAADRWKVIILILLKSLAKQRLPSLQDHLRREDVHTLLLRELAMANTSLEELETFVGMFLDPVT